MLNSIGTIIICFLVCHSGPADHFATFAEQLSEQGYEVRIYASGPALKKLSERNVPVDLAFSLAETTAESLAEKCVGCTAVITDVGDPFAESFQRALAKQSPHIHRLAYYDNPEPYVPGGYSQVAARVMAAAQTVLFANANLAQAENHVGIGYYPLVRAETLAAQRKGRQGQCGRTTLVYFGGNNEEYYQFAFPAFLRIVRDAIQVGDLSGYEIVLQQHPGAIERNRDVPLLMQWIAENGDHPHAPMMKVSEVSSESMQISADAALYYQTSMGPLLALAGVPLIQVGHTVYEDILVREGLCATVTTPTDLFRAVSAISSLPVTEDRRKSIHRALGIRADWVQRLTSSLMR